MEKFIPFEKLSKKQQLELHKSRRGSWGAVNPVTRKSKNPKSYDRNKARKWSDDTMTVPFDCRLCSFLRSKCCFTSMWYMV